LLRITQSSVTMPTDLAIGALADAVAVFSLATRSSDRRVDPWIRSFACTRKKRTARLSNDLLPAGRHIVTAGSVRRNRDTHEDAGTCTVCCYVGVAEREEGGREERGKGTWKRARSLRGSVGNSGGRRVVNFRLHRRAPSRLPRPTFSSSSSSCLLLRLASSSNPAAFSPSSFPPRDLPSSFFSASSAPLRSGASGGQRRTLAPPRT